MTLSNNNFVFAQLEFIQHLSLHWTECLNLINCLCAVFKALEYFDFIVPGEDEVVTFLGEALSRREYCRNEKSDPERIFDRSCPTK